MHYLDAILAFLSGAATRLRPHLDRAWRSAIVLAAGLGTPLHRSTRGARDVAARSSAPLGRWRHSAILGAVRLEAHLALRWRAARRAAARLGVHLARPRRPAVERRRRRVPARDAEAPAPVPRVDPGRQWEIVVGIAARELARVPAIAALQGRAALKIDAAEHALARIVADCAKVLPARATPAPQPAPEPCAPEPQTSPPLAA
jgi:hypothetical protein